MPQPAQPNTDPIKLGELALQTGDVKNALAYAVQELRQNPYSKEAYTLAGRVMQAVGNWSSAASYYLNALRIDPFYKLPHVLFLEHYVNARFEGYDAALMAALERIPDHLFAIDLLLNHYYGYHEWEKAYGFVDRVVSQENVSFAFKCKATLMWTLAKFITGSTEIHYTAQAQRSNENDFSEAERKIMVWVKVYHTLIHQLTQFRKDYPAYYENPPEETLYVVGESHALGCAHVNVTLDGTPLHCSVQHLIGIKAAHFAKSQMNAHVIMHYFEKVIFGIPKGSNVLVMIGEIDCRVDEGILPYALKHNKTIAETVDQTVRAYVKTLSELNALCGHRITLCTVPPVSITLFNEGKAYYGEEKLNRFPQVKEVIKLFNQDLKKYAAEYGFRILDTYTNTIADNGFAKAGMHIDSYHLKPSVIVEAAQHSGNASIQKEISMG